MSETVVAASLTLNADQANESVKSFKTQLREANQELVKTSEKFGETSAQAAMAAKKVAELKDRMGDAKALTDAFNPDRKFQAFSNTISGVAGGFSALQGVMALVGAESEDVQKSLLKVQAALAISQGVNNILELKDTFKQLGAFIQSTTVFQKLNTAATKAAAFVQKLFGLEVNATSTSFKVLKGAIVATGIGALVVLIGEVVSVMQEWTSATEKQIEKQKELQEVVTKSAQAGLEGQLNFIEREQKLQVARAEARGASEEEIFKIQEGFQKSRVKSLGQFYDEIKVVDEVGGQEALSRAKSAAVDLQVLQLQFQKKQLEQKKEADKKSAELAKQEAEKRKAASKEDAERELAGEEELRRLKQDTFKNTIKDEDERRRQEIINEAVNEKAKIEQMKVSGELRLQLIIANRQKERAALDALEAEIQEKQKAKDAERLQQNLDNILGNIQAVAALSRQQLDLRTEIDNQEKDEQQLKLEELQAWYLEKQKIAGANEQLQNDLTAAYEKQRTEIVRTQAMMRLNVVSGILGKAAELFGKQTAAGKVLAIAEATINTFAGATLALREKSILPQPFSTIQKITSAALIVATGFKSIKEILKTNVPGAGSGGGSVPSISAEAPLAPTPQVGTTALDQQSLNAVGNATVRAFVVEGDVTDNQERITRLNRSARLGG